MFRRELEEGGGSFETAASRPPQDEGFFSMPSTIHLMLRSAPRERVSKHAQR
jgi:hypothetical protein